jgi:hypothetical protein
MVKTIVFTLNRLGTLSHLPTVFEFRSPSLNGSNKNKTYTHVCVLVEIRNAVRLTNTNLTKF